VGEKEWMNTKMSFVSPKASLGDLVDKSYAHQAVGS